MSYTKKRRRHRRLLAETGGCCMYCGKPLQSTEATIDHIVPLSRGGYTEDENLTACCYDCNHNKEALFVKDFIKTMQLPKQRAFYIEARHYSSKARSAKRSICFSLT